MGVVWYEEGMVWYVYSGPGGGRVCVVGEGYRVWWGLECGGLRKEN